MIQSTTQITFLLVAFAVNLCGAGAWQELPPLPESNGGFVCSDWEGRVLVLGGTNWVDGEKKWLTGVHLFDPVTQRWESLEPLALPLAYALVGSTPSGLLVAGGSTGTEPFKALLRLERGQVIVQDNPILDSPAVVSAGGLVGEELIVVAGTDDTANLAGFRRDAFAWNVRTGEQRVLPPYPGPAMGITCSVVIDDELLVFGGASWDVTTQKVTNLSGAYAFSLGSNSWRNLRAMPLGVRALAAVQLDANRIYLAGGVHNDAEGTTDRAWIYELAEDRYTPALPLPYRAYVGLVLCDGFVYCLGGEDKGRHRTDIVYRVRVSDLVK